jgi:PncC family amidohydrolase
VAESCTGGGLGREITRIPGSSDVFWGGVVVYANAAKTELADVPESSIREYGAVSEPVAISLSEGIRKRSLTDWSIAITGIAGPGGALPDKPVGTVWMAVSGPTGTEASLFRFTGTREDVRSSAVAAAMELLIDALAP